MPLTRGRRDCEYCAGGIAAPVPDDGCFDDDGTFVKCPVTDACVRGGTCRVGHTGFLCTACEPGFYSRLGLCYECPDGAVFVFILLIGVSFLFVDKEGERG